MTIRIKCPHCQKMLGVRDHLAGKKVGCPACKKPLKIPAAVSAPAANVEDLAAAAFADAPKAAEPAKENKPIEFTCVFCDAEVRVAYELGGKQTPCPECKRIVKVPKPIADKPKDWRTVDRQGPASARQDEPQAPEGAWVPATARKVSQQALAEAGAVPEARAEPVGIRVWIRRAVYATAAVAVVVVAVVWLLNRQRQSKLREGLTRGLEFIEPKSKLGLEATAAVHRAAGEFFAHNSEPKKAEEHLGKGRAFALQLPAQGPASLERDALLRDFALTWVDLAGSPQEVDDGKRVGWDKVQKDLERTLLQIDAEARPAALRDVTTRLLEQGKDGEIAAMGLAVKLEITPHQVALLLARGNDKEAGERLPAPTGDPNRETRAAYAQGLARKGKYADALALADKPGLALERLSALLDVAALALADSNPSARADSARPAAEKAFDLGWAEAKKGRKIPPWTFMELGRVTARTGQDERARQVLTRLSDKAAKGRVQLELVLLQLDATPGYLDPAGVSLPEKDSLSHGLALEALARHNTRVGSRAAVLASVESLEENLRPFVLVGSALGETDARRR